MLSMMFAFLLLFFPLLSLCALSLLPFSSLLESFFQRLARLFLLCLWCYAHTCEALGFRVRVAIRARRTACARLLAGLISLETRRDAFEGSVKVTRGAASKLDRMAGTPWGTGDGVNTGVDGAVVAPGSTLLRRAHLGRGWVAGLADFQLA